METLKLVQVTPESLAEIVKNAVSSELERFSDLFKKSESDSEYFDTRRSLQETENLKRNFKQS